MSVMQDSGGPDTSPTTCLDCCRLSHRECEDGVTAAVAAGEKSAAGLSGKDVAVVGMVGYLPDC